MNLILLFQDDFISGTSRVCLKGRRYQHIRDVHRASIGKELCVGLCNGRIGRGTITDIDDQHIELNVKLGRKAPKALNVRLVLALPRPNMVKRILATAASMGVKHIILFHSRRVEKSFWKSPVLKEENIREQLILGLEQARDTVMPKVELRKRFKPFVEDELKGLAKRTLRLVAHPEAQRPFPAASKRTVTLVIGPEGGFVPFEIETFSKIGFQAVHLGERILRVESAVPALLSKLTN